MMFLSPEPEAELVRVCTPFYHAALGREVEFEAVSADLQFDRVSFSNEITEGRALPFTTTYTCPTCSERVEFSKEDFEERAGRRISELPPPLQGAFDEWAVHHDESGRPFLDWPCPGCAGAVRVYAHPWAGDRHGDSGVDLSVTLEAPVRR